MLDGSIAFLLDKLFETSLSPRDAKVIDLVGRLDMANKSAKIVNKKDFSETVFKVTKIIGNKKSVEVKKAKLNEILGVNVVSPADIVNSNKGTNGADWLFQQDWQAKLAREVKSLV